MKNVALLGSTGSIGVNTLEVIRRHPSRFRAVALAAGRNISLLREQIALFKPRLVAVLLEEDARILAGQPGVPPTTEVLWGSEGYRAVATCGDSQMVLSAMVGAAGLVPTMEAIAAGKDIALANKETLVMAGRLVVDNAAKKGIRILPVDSEHSAIFQCLAGQNRSEIRKIILTASGGPFLHLPPEQLPKVTIEDALRHPNWKMGKKITIDSATMMNKGLEVIEAHWLFNVDFAHIDVLIHPQSVIHSLVEYHDGSVMAQLGIPDMKGPISYALSYPERLPGVEASLDLLRTECLTFLPPDTLRFPCLKLAYEAGKKGGTMPAIMNAANEMAVEAFLAGRIGFVDIPRVIEETLSAQAGKETSSLDVVLDADRQAREAAEEFIKGLTKKI